jgi:hypothetical protein
MMFMKIINIEVINNCNNSAIISFVILTIILYIINIPQLKNNGRLNSIYLCNYIN